MGKASSTFRAPQYFPEKTLQHYSECTYFTEQEINKLYGIFTSLNPAKFTFRGELVGNSQVKLSFSEVQTLRELKECPFAERLCEIFGSGERMPNRGLNFEDFLDMMSVFSPRAPWNLKAAYAFKIFDFNNDCLICTDDIKIAINCVTDGGHGIAESDIDEIIELVLQEIESVSLDHITYTEFEHMMATAPDFAKQFTINLL